MPQTARVGLIAERVASALEEELIRLEEDLLAGSEHFTDEQRQESLRTADCIQVARACIALDRARGMYERIAVRVLA